jgi:hypothetical protein
MATEISKKVPPVSLEEARRYLQLNEETKTQDFDPNAQPFVEAQVIGTPSTIYLGQENDVHAISYPIPSDAETPVGKICLTVAKIFAALALVFLAMMVYTVFWFTATPATVEEAFQFSRNLTVLCSLVSVVALCWRSADKPAAEDELETRAFLPDDGTGDIKRSREKKSKASAPPVPKKELTPTEKIREDFRIRCNEIEDNCTREIQQAERTRNQDMQKLERDEGRAASIARRLPELARLIQNAGDLASHANEIAQLSRQIESRDLLIEQRKRQAQTEFAQTAVEQKQYRAWIQCGRLNSAQLTAESQKLQEQIRAKDAAVTKLEETPTTGRGESKTALAKIGALNQEKSKLQKDLDLIGHVMSYNIDTDRADARLSVLNELSLKKVEERLEIPLLEENYLLAQSELVRLQTLQARYANLQDNKSEKAGLKVEREGLLTRYGGEVGFAARKKQIWDTYSSAEQAAMSRRDAAKKVAITNQNDQLASAPPAEQLA